MIVVKNGGDGKLFMFYIYLYFPLNKLLTPMKLERHYIRVYIRECGVIIILRINGLCPVC